MVSDKKRYVFIHFIIWLFIGLVCTVSLSAAHLTHAGLLDDFYNIGEVQDYPRWDMAVTIPEEGYVVALPTGECTNIWRYMVLTVEDSTADHIDVSFEFYKNNADTPYAVREASLSDGRNIVKIKKKKFASIVMRISGQAGESFNLARFQLREWKPISNLTKRMGKRCIFWSVIYVLISSMIIFLYKRSRFQVNWERPANILLRIYTFFGNGLGRIPEKIPVNMRRILRMFLFLFLLLYFNAKYISAFSYFPRYGFVQETLLCSLVLLFIAVLCLEKTSYKQKWNTRLVKTWIILSILMMISDVFVIKRQMFNGLVLLGVFGFLIYAWNTMHSKNLLIKELLSAVHIYFIILTICCFIFRANVYYDGRYVGVYKNTVTFSLHCSFIAVLALAELSNALSKNKFDGYSVFYIFEFLLTGFFVWKAQGRSALLVILLVLFLAAVRHFILIFRWKYAVKNTLLAIGLIIVLVFPVFQGTDYLLNQVFVKLNTQTYFSGETASADVFMKDAEMIVSTKEDMVPGEMASVSVGQPDGITKERKIWDQIKDSRIVNSLKGGSLEAVFSGRTLIWKAYAREMNLFGHYYVEKIEGVETWAHCALLQVPYQFGVFALIPYVFMVVITLWKSFVYMFTDMRKRRYAMVPMAIVIVYGVFAAFDMVEHLYSFFPWIAFYLIMGMFFSGHLERGSENYSRTKRNA